MAQQEGTQWCALGCCGIPPAGSLTPTLSEAAHDSQQEEGLDLGRCGQQYQAPGQAPSGSFLEFPQ